MGLRIRILTGCQQRLLMQVPFGGKTRTDNGNVDAPCANAAPISGTNPSVNPEGSGLPIHDGYEIWSGYVDPLAPTGTYKK